MTNVRIFDNGGETADRYTAVFLDSHSRHSDTYTFIGMCSNPTSPQGFGQHGEVTSGYFDDTDDAEITLDDLPNKAKNLVIQLAKEY